MISGISCSSCSLATTSFGLSTEFCSAYETFRFAMEIRISVLLLIFAVVGSFAGVPRSEDPSATTPELPRVAENKAKESNNPIIVPSSGSVRNESIGDSSSAITPTTATVTTPPQSVSILTDATTKASNQVTTGLGVQTKATTETTTTIVTSNPPLENKSGSSVKFANGNHQQISPQIPSSFGGSNLPSPIHSLPQTIRIYPHLSPNCNFPTSSNPSNTWNSNQGYRYPFVNFPPPYRYPFTGNRGTPPYPSFNLGYNQPNIPVSPRGNFYTDNSYPPFNGLRNDQNPYYNGQFTNNYPIGSLNQPNVNQADGSTVTSYSNTKPLLASLIREYADLIADEILSKNADENDSTSNADGTKQVTNATPVNSPNSANNVSEVRQKVPS